MIDFEKDVEKFNLDLYCPKCRHLIRAIPQTKPIYHIGEHSDNYAYLIVRCPRHLCDLAFVIYDRLNRHVRRVFPYPCSSAADFHEAIPENIREDFAEAHKCWYGGSYKGVVVMCRRVMQLIAIDKGADGDKLMDQIDSLFSKRLITKSLHDAAHEVRFFGNFGAHPRDDGLDNISDEDANIVKNLTNQFLTDLYVLPFETGKLTKKRTKNKK